MKKTLTLTIIIIILAAAFAFVVFYKDKDKEDEKPVKEKEKPVAEIASPKDIIETSHSATDFAFDIYREAAEEGNRFMSPYSIHSALLLAYIGASGETAEEMEKVLALHGIDAKDLKKDFRDLRIYLENVSPETKISIANALFLREDIPFKESFKDDGVGYFDAEISSLPETGESINEWVRQKTEEKIEEIIDSGNIDEDVIAYLVNAIYFKGSWKKEFDEDKTRKSSFKPPQGEVEVDMMENKGDYRYGISENVKAVTLEYEEGDYLFHAFMPLDDSLNDFYENLDRETFEDIKPTNKGEITLKIPKFTMEDDLVLSEVLRSMGMIDALDEGRADFSEMVDLEDLGLNVYMSEIFHSSFIEVDEKGSEAAAATAVEMRLEMAAPQETIVEFNKPFFFVIEEAETGTALFMGQLVNPDDL